MNFPIKKNNHEGYFAIAIVAGASIAMATVIAIAMFYQIFIMNEKEQVIKMSAVLIFLLCWFLFGLLNVFIFIPLLVKISNKINHIEDKMDVDIIAYSMTLGPIFTIVSIGSAIFVFIKKKDINISGFINKFWNLP